MNVGKLIKELEKYPEDMKVFYINQGYFGELEKIYKDKNHKYITTKNKEDVVILEAYY